MQFEEKYIGFLKEDVSLKESCNLCQESNLKVGEKSEYGAVVVYRIGNSPKDTWLAMLSPKTGGNPKEDFTIQLTPFNHLTHFSQLDIYPELAKNYGMVFSKISNAITKIMAQENRKFDITSSSREYAISLATYGKSTNWIDKKEHLHIKIFPFRGTMGQPFTVDSSFAKKEIHKDPLTHEEFVKMNPIKKSIIEERRFKHLSERLIEILK